MRRRSVLPGFGLSMGFTVLYLSLVVLLPLSALAVTGLGLSWEKIGAAVLAPRTVAAFRLSLSCAAAAAAVTAVLGLLVAWVLVRYPFPGRRLVDALVDLPFALPTAVAGVTLTALYAESGWLGGPLSKLGIKVAHTPLGIVLALIFIGLPFVVRTVQPVLQDLDPELEDAARSLGASRPETFRRVLLPELAPALLTGATLAFARGLGEYGSVIFIAGNMPGKTEIVPLLVLIKLEQYDYAGAAAVALASLLLSFLLLLALNLLQGPKGLLNRAARRKAVAP